MIHVQYCMLYDLCKNTLHVVSLYMLDLKIKVLLHNTEFISDLNSMTFSLIYEMSLTGIYFKYMCYTLTLSPIQQSCSRRHLEKILNIHFADRNEIGAISSFVTMFSNVICCSRRKNEYLWSKGLIVSYF